MNGMKFITFCFFDGNIAANGRGNDVFFSGNSITQSPFENCGSTTQAKRVWNNNTADSNVNDGWLWLFFSYSSMEFLSFFYLLFFLYHHLSSHSFFNHLFQTFDFNCILSFFPVCYFASLAFLSVYPKTFLCLGSSFFFSQAQLPTQISNPNIFFLSSKDIFNPLNFISI
ncbi:uncharacterized protein MONOS_18539 [Monocercomonoides exilis]|uniref:uncharacterized protein n=1 Tax=Monocercomonoides exilis TaxID=2049356 RepID=UPI003559B0EA|nr:hypothetical protein MONOS_18539 [Monocercomonoides exilis]